MENLLEHLEGALGAMYDEYTRAHQRQGHWQDRLEKYQNMLKYI